MDEVFEEYDENLDNVFIKLEILRMATDIFNTAVAAKSEVVSTQQIYLDLIKVFNDSEIINK